MGKKLSYAEKFERFKEEVKSDFLNLFLHHYNQFKDIEEGLINEKIKEFNDRKG